MHFLVHYQHSLSNQVGSAKKQSRQRIKIIDLIFLLCIGLVLEKKNLPLQMYQLFFFLLFIFHNDQYSIAFLLNGSSFPIYPLTAIIMILLLLLSGSDSNSLQYIPLTTVKVRIPRLKMKNRTFKRRQL